MKNVCTAIQCNRTNLPNFTDAQTSTPNDGLFPFNYHVTYVCTSAGHRFEDGNVNTAVTCSATGWTWNDIVTSCGRMSFVSLCSDHVNVPD